MTVLALGLAAGAYADDFGRLAGIKAADLKASAAKEEISVPRPDFQAESPDAEDKSVCGPNSMAPGCCGYCRVSPMYPGCPRFCAKNHGYPACRNGGVCGSPKSFADKLSGAKSSDGSEKGWCDEHSMAPGCCGYCKVSPMYPGCPMYCSKNGHHGNPACANGGVCGSPKNLSADDYMKALCPPGALIPGCPSFCAVYPTDPTCEGMSKSRSEEKDTKALCPPGALIPGCPSFCAVYPTDPTCEGMSKSRSEEKDAKVLCPPGALIPGCPSFCAVYPTDPTCEGMSR
ncbi:MAG TPA: hypothetical protein PL037_10130 [Elusimicrobiales bacterium]|nr:hypothetical protein [Elusimicrobiales bacterium]